MSNNADNNANHNFNDFGNELHENSPPVSSNGDDTHTTNFDNWMLENDINHLEAENWNPDSFNQYIL